MKTLLVVCARKGSKRLPDKHNLGIGNKKLWAYALIAVKALDRGGSIGSDRSIWAVVSTDDNIILQGAGEMNISYVRRPDNLAADDSPIHEALQHAVQSFSNFYKPDVVGFIPANVPTVTSELILACINRMKKERGLTSVLTVRRVREIPEWMLYGDPRKGAATRAFLASEKRYRMQDIPVRYIATGSVGLVRTKTLMACKTGSLYEYLGPKIGMVLDENALEIHDFHDYELAKAYLEVKAK
jgi:CMP-N-acetylneuraminic acid synthetase